ncbi:MAG: glycosyltransferase [Nostocaceae cyanobacterium]|nr:glycosyltransferase [Nostocaceae cyanobacterium]
MKKLLIVTTIPDTLCAFFLPFASHFRAKGWRVDAMSCGISANKQCLQAFDNVWDVKWSRNPLDPTNLMVAPQQIRSCLAQQEYDIVHVTTPVAAFVTRYALNGWKQPNNLKVIYTALGFHFHRNGSLIKNSIFQGLEKLAGNWTDYVVTINREDEEAAKRNRLVPEDRVRYIPGPGLDMERFNRNLVPSEDIAPVRQELGLHPETPLFLAVAEFIPRKRHRDMLKAFARLARRDVHLALAGTGPLMEQMRQLASELGIENQVHFLGFRRDIPTLMCASIATVLTSEQEGLPHCVLESLSLETPVIGTDIRGTRDLVEGGCGLLVRLGDIEALTAAMGWMLGNSEATRIMGQRGRDKLAECELSQVLKQYEALYTEVASVDSLVTSQV